MWLSFVSISIPPDFYKADSTRTDPRGPLKGQEHVIRGGSFKSDAKDVRSAARDFTKTKAWLVTDPQMPKSIWWYSDCIDVGFRVVCETDTSAGKLDSLIILDKNGQYKQKEIHQDSSSCRYRYCRRRGNYFRL